MFSAKRLAAKCDFSPKNEPVPSQPRGRMMGRGPRKSQPPDHRKPGRRREMAAAATDSARAPTMIRSRDGATLGTNAGGLDSYWVLAICGFLVLAVVLVFGQTIRHEFVNFDDNVYVYENPQVTQGLTADGIAWAITTRHANNWHPLT